MDAIEALRPLYNRGLYCIGGHLTSMGSIRVPD
jgi:hypothetical protein